MTSNGKVGYQWYFAYGSNMQSATFRVRRKIEPAEVQIGHLADYRLCFDLPVGPGERGVANVEPASGERVWGVLYSITDAQFDFLDRTEGVTQGFYRRVQVGIVGADGRVCEAATYVSDRGVAGRKASMRYLGLVLDGAREHGLPKSYVRALEGFEVAVDEREGETSPSD